MIFDEQIFTNPPFMDLVNKCCSKCKNNKSISLFPKRKNKIDSWCKQCYIENAKTYSKKNKEKIAIKKKEYVLKNKIHIAEKQKEYSLKNKLNISLYQKEYCLKNKELKTQYDKEYYLINKDKKNTQNKKWRKLRKKTDPSFRFKCNISKQFWNILSKGHGKNGNKTLDILNSLGYSLNELKIHLENKFTEGMSWENYGKWHVDHIKPVCSFKFSSIEDPSFKECWCLENLRPLWAKDNFKKISSDIKQSIHKKYENRKLH